MKKIITEPKWKRGKPNAPGLWVIEEINKDYVIAEIAWLEPIWYEGKPYLSITINGDGEELRTYKQAKRSYGPIPTNRVTQT